MECIENIYINKDYSVIWEYISQIAPLASLEDKNKLQRKVGCVVLIEVNSLLPAQMAKGMRRTDLTGYTNPVEFYSPDYSENPPFEPDYRRTLYWSPDIRPDADGTVRIRFFNNSTASRMNVSTATFPGQ